MSSYMLPLLYVIFLWWFSTGVILYLDGLPKRTYWLSMVCMTALLIAALAGLAESRSDMTVVGVYTAFTCSIVAWGWIEMSFLMGMITGSQKQTCESGCHGWRHFGHGVQAVLYHELAIVALAAIIAFHTWGGSNQFGLYAFLLLWGMRQSAKLNLFLGVRNLNEDWLPDGLSYLRSYLRRKPMNALFPLSVTIATAATAYFFYVAMNVDTEFMKTGNVFLGVLMMLGLLEHWLLVIPFSASALWAWGLKSHRPPAGGDLSLAHSSAAIVATPAAAAGSSSFSSGSALRVSRVSRRRSRAGRRHTV